MTMIGKGGDCDSDISGEFGDSDKCGRMWILTMT